MADLYIRIPKSNSVEEERLDRKQKIAASFRLFS